MRSRQVSMSALLVAGLVCSVPAVSQAQCCLSGLFSGAGCGCFKKAAPAYAVAPVPAPPPVAAVAAPVAAPAPPPQPVMVPVQQVSYVPETTYQTQYKCVPVTCYRPTCEIDPCTGCAVECVELVTNYVQQPVSVPVTQYRAVYTTKYVQMQPGGNPQAYTGAAVVPPNAAGAAASPFASPQTTPQAWGAAGTAVPPSVPTQQPVLPPATGGSTYQQQIVPQSGTFAAPQAPVQPQPTSPPALAPTPSLRPIPELPQQPASQQPQQRSDASSPAATDLRDPGTEGTSPAPQQFGPVVTPPPSLRPIPVVGPTGGFLDCWPLLVLLAWRRSAFFCVGYCWQPPLDRPTSRFLTIPCGQGAPMVFISLKEGPFHSGGLNWCWSWRNRRPFVKAPMFELKSRWSGEN